MEGFSFRNMAEIQRKNQIIVSLSQSKDTKEQQSRQ